MGNYWRGLLSLLVSQRVTARWMASRFGGVGEEKRSVTVKMVSFNCITPWSNLCWGKTRHERLTPKSNLCCFRHKFDFGVFTFARGTRWGYTARDRCPALILLANNKKADIIDVCEDFTEG